MDQRIRRRIVMLGTAPRTQRSHSSVQLPADFSSTQSSVPHFIYRTDDFVYDLHRLPSSFSHEKSLCQLIAHRWESAREKNALNYNLNCMYKYLDGPYNLTIQLNVERGELRRKPMRFRKIREPFNSVRWNFTRLHDNEVLLYFRCEDRPITEDPLDRHVLAVNASPLERNHCLLVPAVNKCHPQVLTHLALRMGTDFMLLNHDENAHILFNSLLGHASVNHLHLHSLPWPYDSEIVFRRCEPLAGVEGVFTIKPPQWISQAFVFQLTGKDHYDKFLDQLSICVDLLLSHEQSHNVFFARAAPIRVEGEEREEDRDGSKPLRVTAYFFPRINMMGPKPPTNFNPAAAELAGCLTAYTYKFFDSVTEQSALRVVTEEAQLPEHIFESLCSDLSEALLGRKVSIPRVTPSFEGLTSPEMDELRDSFSSFDPPSPSRLPRRRSVNTIQIPEIILT
ncbi:mcp-1 [Pristionchus pacificus]|uniref:GDP-D-glucose phosphorylase 1 n=1 Tax=Pristionchus pacificus TaxID=54126 RepID=A0A2A6CT26_PRIPA|nr:mcp-1 [Pristionchus pacificus]|eukprot:PDM81258.1 mcp-1 [Pristionchus pacificus]